MVLEIGDFERFAGAVGFDDLEAGRAEVIRGQAEDVEVERRAGKAAEDLEVTGGARVAHFDESAVGLGAEDGERNVFAVVDADDAAAVAVKIDVKAVLGAGEAGGGNKAA